MDSEPFLRAHIRGNPIEPLLTQLVDRFVSGGYSATASSAYVRSAVHFGRWLGQRPLNVRTAQSYLKRHLPTCHCRGLAPCDPRWNAGAVHHLLTLAEQTAGMPPVVEGFAHEILKRYREYLTRERGVKPSTIRFSIRQARRTLSDLKARNPDDLRRWSPERLRRHVVREVQGYAGSTSQATTSRIRVFLSFLAREESIAPELATSVSTVPFWRRAMPRPPLADQTIKRLMSAAAADRTPQGLRNHAIILCLSELGIRASDLVGLELDGLDCAAGTLRLRHIKDRQETELPMSRRLASALKTYIKQGRPKCVAPWVFVHHRAPTGKQLSSHGVRDVLGKLSVSAGLPAPIQSTHAFRRAFAGRMLQAGASLKQIADVLGHQSINTTVRYTHTDIQALAKVALPWPATREALP